MTRTALTKSLASLALAGTAFTGFTGFAGFAGTAEASSPSLFLYSARGKANTASVVLPWIAQSRGSAAGGEADCWDWTNEDGTHGTNCPDPVPSGGVGAVGGTLTLPQYD
jgi:hypothetical protein